jgi:hypothetical protein
MGVEKGCNRFRDSCPRRFQGTALHVHHRSCHVHNHGPVQWLRYGTLTLSLSFTTRSTPYRMSKARFLRSQGSLSTTSSRIYRFPRATSLVGSVYLASPTSPRARSTTTNGTRRTVPSDAVRGRIMKTKSTRSSRMTKRISTSRWKRRMSLRRRGHPNG